MYFIHYNHVFIFFYYLLCYCLLFSVRLPDLIQDVIKYFLIQKVFRPILSTTVSELYSNLHRQTPNFCADRCSR
jgi:hypothetical protein